MGIFVLVTSVFLLLEAIPGDPARTIAGPYASQEAVDAISTDLGLDQPLGDRYLDYWANLAKGDLGNSLYSNRPVLAEMRLRLPFTLEILIPALLVALSLGVTLGSISAKWPKSRRGTTASSVTTLVQSTPDFVAALIIIHIAVFSLDILPAPVGRMGIGAGTSPGPTGLLSLDALLTGDFALMARSMWYLVGPVMALGLAYSAYFARVTRGALATILQSDQVHFAKCLGLSGPRIFGRALLEATPGIMTYGAILFGALLGGAAIIETVFAWPGVGQWALSAMLSLDVPAIQGFVLVAGTIALIAYAVLDVALVLLDPRVRQGG